MNLALTPSLGLSPIYLLTSFRHPAAPTPGHRLGGYCLDSQWQSGNAAPVFWYSPEQVQDTEKRVPLAQNVSAKELNLTPTLSLWEEMSTELRQRNI